MKIEKIRGKKRKKEENEPMRNKVSKGHSFLVKVSIYNMFDINNAVHGKFNILKSTAPFHLISVLIGIRRLVYVFKHI